MVDRFAAHAASLTLFIEEVRKNDPKRADVYLFALIDLFRTDDGRKVLDLLERAVLLAQPPLGVSDCALRQIHGQRHLVAEIRGLVANGRGTRTDGK